jgi:ribosomal protein S18 acetylase RimI-like enzyme
MPEDSRFETEPADLVQDHTLPEGWVVDGVEPARDVDRLTELLRAHEQEGRGWATSDREDVLVEVSPRGELMRANMVLRDPEGVLRGWGSVHDRAAGRMLLVHVVDRTLEPSVGDRCATVLLDWADGQAREVGAARGLDVQQIDTGAFADDAAQQRWLARGGFEQVRTWWQMGRPVTADEATLVPDPSSWCRGDLTVRLVRREEADGMPAQKDLRAVHDVLEAAFEDHFNSYAETFDEFVHRLREDPGHRWDHWWLAEVEDLDGTPGSTPVGALVATASGSGSYVSYIGVLDAARGRGVAKGLLRTVIADAAARGKDTVTLEVDATSPTGAHGLYTSMGWETRYVTQSWHRDVPTGA